MASLFGQIGHSSEAIVGALYERLSLVIRYEIPLTTFPSTTEFYGSNNIVNMTTDNDDIIATASVEKKRRDTLETKVEIASLLDQYDAEKLSDRIQEMEERFVAKPIVSKELQNLGVRIVINDVEINVGILEDGSHVINATIWLSIRH